MGVQQACAQSPAHSGGIPGILRHVRIRELLPRRIRFACPLPQKRGQLRPIHIRVRRELPAAGAIRESVLRSPKDGGIVCVSLVHVGKRILLQGRRRAARLVPQADDGLAAAQRKLIGRRCGRREHGGHDSQRQQQRQDPHSVHTCSPFAIC